MKRCILFSLVLLCAVFLLSACTQTRLQPPAAEPTAQTPTSAAEMTQQSAKIVHHYVSDGSRNASCYITPQPGTFFCFTEVDAARAENKHDADVLYLLKTDIFTADGEATQEQRKAEYERLRNAGIDFFECSYWTYIGEHGEKEYHTAMLGLFSEQELANFTPQAEYGYAFSFLTNGDSSAIDLNEQVIRSSSDRHRKNN